MVPAPEAPDRSMGLLVDMSASSLDPAYRDHAEQRRSQGDGPRRSTPMVLVVLLLVGAATGVVAGQVRDRSDRTGAVRRSLVQDVRAQTRVTDALARRVEIRRAEVDAARDRALTVGEQGRALAATLRGLALASGTTEVRGPGLLVRLDDARSDSPAAARGGQTGNGRIYDRDLQDVANALWAAGAEAISVNDQRLTVQTAIRSAGEAVLVDLRPLSPPYRVRAVGEVATMEPAFADSPAARRLRTLTSVYGVGFRVSPARRLDLPAAATPVLRAARAAGPADHP